MSKDGQVNQHYRNIEKYQAISDGIGISEISTLDELNKLRISREVTFMLEITVRAFRENPI
jgi:hypothetical protein